MAASLEDVLNQVKEGSLDVKEAKTLLSSFEDIGFAKVDHQREDRTGFPEVIFGEGKTVEQMIDIIRVFEEEHEPCPSDKDFGG